MSELVEQCVHVQLLPVDRSRYAGNENGTSPFFLKTAVPLIYAEAEVYGSLALILRQSRHLKEEEV